MRISDWSSDVCSSDLVAARLDQAEMDVEAVREGERGAGLQIVGEVVIIDFRLMLVGGGDHDDVGPGGGVLVGHDLEARAFGLLCGRRTGTERRSEEHTYELQSLMRISYAVFCLKKKQNP